MTTGVVADRRCQAAECPSARLTAIDYRRLILPAHELSHPSFVMNVAGQGHLELAERFTAALGLAKPVMGLAAARRLHSTGAPLVYMTLTNDHLPATERSHDATLAWERATQAVSSLSTEARFIGPPGKYTDEATRKKDFCRWSEQLARASGDRSLRYALPCAVGESTPGVYQADYEQLLGEEERHALSGSGTRESQRPLWLVRTLRGKNRVIAFGAGMRFEVLPTSMLTPASMQPGKSLLMRFLDPPLLQHGTHLGVPVATRFEVRLHGLVQWQPLRVWVSGHGFARGGSPWWNYSSAARLNESNRLMWELSAAPDPSCAAKLPRTRAPWVTPERFEACSGRSRSNRGGHRKERDETACCICMTVADAIDAGHGERGFATTGTLRRIEQIARQNGLAPSALWQNADEAIVRYLMMQQRAFVAEANGSTLARWQTPFSVDIAFSSDAKAWIYDSHLLPTWKRPGHWKNWLIDRGNALGSYSPMILAMSHLLVSRDAVENLHRPLLPADYGGSKLLLEFLRDQGFASVLGFRRAWPSSGHAQFYELASREDAQFAQLVDRAGLLLESMDARKHGSHIRRRKDLLLAEDKPRWPFSGALYANSSKPPICEGSAAVVHSWDATTVHVQP
mmetsp:Transcript_40329/g.106853  ORF Transcript_40329/g.106853 Transcript_40329/m.106853 type:complete len:626 (+) Transcript_40329:35-1912(+)